MQDPANELPRIPLPRTRVNKAPSEPCAIFFMGRGSGVPYTGTQRILQSTFGKEMP
jgi:hypothetical protein